MTLARGRGLRLIPGPSVMPDRVLSAMHRAAPNIYEGGLLDLTERVRADLRRVVGTVGEVAIYLGNGHAAWEAAVANVLAPGDWALVLSTGRFALGWGELARKSGVETEVLDFGFQAGVDPDRLEARLRTDDENRIKAVLVVQTDTASSVRNDVPAIRAAIDAAGHPALLLVDCIASLGCDRFEMDAWGVDVTVAACQKGLMTPPGVAFTFHGPKAEAARVRCPSQTWDWEKRIRPDVFYQYFGGTPPTHHLYGLREALSMILDEEGLEAVWDRHAVHARVVWASVEAWGTAAGGLTLNVPHAAERSHAVTTVRTASGAASDLRGWCEAEAGLTLGIGLSGPDVDDGALFRIGHMGHLDPVMLLGGLAAVEAGMKATGMPHAEGGLSAAARVIAKARAARTPAAALAPV